MTGRGSGKRGRPLGYRLSESTKRAISQAKTGQKHNQRTKDKISRSLIMYFRAKNPLSEEISNRYYRFDFDGELSDWVEDNADNLDMSINVLTEKSLRNKGKIEIACGDTIEFFSHGITPEVIILFREYCESTGKGIEEVLEEAGII